MPEYNKRYHNLNAAKRYQEKITSKRKFSTWLENRMVRRSLDRVEGTTILDCPCGTGRIDDVLRARFSQITGVDNAAPMLELYKSGNVLRKGELSDIFDLPFDDETFDWVICHRLFHHFKKDEERIRLLKSLSRVSRRGVSFYAWLTVPLSKRGRTPVEGRQTIDREHLSRLIGETDLKLRKIYYACWPFSTKSIAVCGKS